MKIQFNLFFSLSRTCVFILTLFGVSFSVCAQKVEFKTLQEEIDILEKAQKESPRNLATLKKLVEKYNLNSNYVRAEKVILDYQHKYVKKNNKRVQGEVYLLLAITYKYQTEYEQSAICFLKAKDIFNKIKAYSDLIILGAEYTEFYRKQAKYEEAEKTYYKFRFLATKYGIDNPKILNKLYNRFAAVLNETNRPYPSIDYSNKAILEAQKTNDQNAMAISYNEIGFSLKNLKKINKSAESYFKAEEIWMKLGYYRDAIQAKMNRVTMLSHNLIYPYPMQLKSSLEVVELIDKYNVDYSKRYPYEIIRSCYSDYYKDYKMALIYEQKLAGERLREMELNSQSEVVNIQEKYDNENLQRKNKVIAFKAREKQLELENVKTRVILIAIILLVVVSALIALFIFWMRLRMANKLLIIRNNQKTLLVQEIHHRVKNNMQFVKSMLEMQIGVEESESSTKSLEDVYRRIDAMSLVHEMLFIDEANMNLSIKDYLEKLIDFSNILYNKDHKIAFKLTCVNVELPIDQIVSIGIIATELLTNSIKYAFQDHQEPTISFELTQNGSNYQINYSDNGVGMTQKEEESRKTLGMRLIDIFSRQLNGEYSIYSDNGFHFDLKFKK